MISLCQPWLLSLFISPRPCDQVLSFPAKYTRARARAHTCTRSRVYAQLLHSLSLFALALFLACSRTVRARGDKICTCGWKCRTAVYPVGRVGWVTRKRLRSYLVNANRTQFLPRDSRMRLPSAAVAAVATPRFVDSSNPSNSWPVTLDVVAQKKKKEEAATRV